MTEKTTDTAKEANSAETTEQTIIDDTIITAGSLSRGLKKCREAADMDIKQAADEMRLPVHVLKSLEAENFAELPEPPYIRGYLRSYSRLNDSDPNELIRRYEVLRGANPDDITSFSPATTANRNANKNKPSVSPATVKLAGLALMVLVLGVLSMIPAVSQWVNDTWRSFSERTAEQQLASEENTQQEQGTEEAQNTAGSIERGQDTNNTDTGTTGTTANTTNSTASTNDTAATNNEQLALNNTNNDQSNSATDTAEENTTNTGDSGTAENTATDGVTDNAAENTSTNTAGTNQDADAASQTAATDGDGPEAAEMVDTAAEEKQKAEEEEAARKLAEEKKKAEAEEAARKLAEEKQKAEAEEAARKLAEEKQKAEEEAKKLAAAEAAKKAEEQKKADNFQQPMDGTVHIQLIFSESVWMSIKDVKGKNIFASLNTPGTRKQLKARTPLNFRVGNARGVKIYVNGQLVDQKPYTRGSISQFRIR